MRPKKLLSSLLAAALVASMIPLNAVAALAPGETAKENILQVDLMVSSTFNGSNAAKDIPAYNSQGVAVKAESEADMKNVYEAYQEVFQPEESLEVAGNETVFLGVKMRLKNPGKYGDKSYKGIAGPPNLVIKFDNSKVTPVTVNARTAVNKAATTQVFNSQLLEKAYDVFGEGANADYKVLAEKYRSSLVAPDLKVIGNNSLVVSYKFEDNYSYLSNDTTWDYVIPFTVTGGVTGDINFEVIKSATGASSGDESSHTSATFSCQDMGWNGEAFVDVSLAMTSENYAVTPTNENKDHYLSADASAKAVIRSDPPAVDPGIETQYAITDKKNLPYISGEYAKNATKDGPNDYIEIPANSGFKLSDSVVVYADAEGTKKLGQTQIIGANIHNPSTGKWNYPAADQDAVDAGITLRLVTDKGNGHGYIKGEDQVWLARLQDGANMSPSKTLIGPITVTQDATHPEYNEETQPFYYSADVDAVEKGAPGSKGNPVEIQLGDTVQDVLKKISDNGIELPASVAAPYESAQGKTVDVSVNWTKWKDHSQPSVDSASDAYILHTVKDGDTVLRIPFANKSAGTENPVIQQPVNMYDDTANQAVAAPTFGSVIHIKVVPRETDYMVKNLGGTKKAVQISGKTYRLLNAGDEIKFYAAEDAATAVGTAVIPARTPATDEAGKVEIELTEVDEAFPLQNKEVWLEVTQKVVGDVGAPRFATTVTDGVLQVVKTEVAPSGAEDGVYTIGPKTTALQLFAQSAPKFYVQTIDTPFEVDVKTINYDSAVTYTKLEAAGVALDPAEDSTMEAFNGTKLNGDLYELSYTIPDNGSADPPYKNSAKHTITLKARVSTRVEIQGGDENDPDAGLTTLTTKMVNSPDISRNDASSAGWDIFELSGVNIEGLTDQEKVAEKDRVSVYKGEALTPFTTGFVKTVDATNTKNVTYTIWVEQLGRTPDYSELSFTVSHDWVMNSRKIKFTQAIPKESYTLVEPVTAPWDDVVKVYDDPATPYASVADLLENAPEVPKNIVLDYQYFTKNVADASSMGHKTIALNPTNWVVPDTVENTADLTGEQELTYELSLADLTTDTENVKILAENATVTLKLKLKTVGQRYTGPGITDVLKSVSTKVNNKPYPEDDEMIFTNPASVKDKQITVKVFTTENDAINQTNPIITIAPPAVAPAAEEEEPNPEYFDGSGHALRRTIPAGVLGTTTDKVYVTVQDGDSAPSLSVAKSYSTEPYLVWDVTLNQSEAEVTYHQKNIDDLADDAARLKYFTEVLPETMSVTLVHLVPGENTTYAPNDAETQYLSIPVSKWYSQPGTEFSLADLCTTAPTIDKDSVSLSTVLEKSDVAGKTVTYVGADGKDEVLPVNYDVDATRPADFNQASLTLNLTAAETELTTLVLPGDAATHITLDRNNTPVYTDDSIVIDFSSYKETADWSMVNGLSVTVEYPGPTGTENISGTLDADGKLTINNTTEGFKGLSSSQSKAKFTFSKDGYTNAAISKDLSAYSGAYVLKEIVGMPTLNMMAGTIRSVDDLKKLVPFVTVTGVADDAASTQITEIPLKQVAQGSVDWDLYKGTKNPDETITWESTPVTNDWKDELAVYDKDTAYKLVAPLNLEGFKFNDRDVKQPDVKEVVAEVLITLYNDAEPLNFPIVLTDGNNDLWNSLKDNTTASADDIVIAQKELALRNKGLAVENQFKPEDFRTDAVFYYFSDSYSGFEGEQSNAQHVQGYVENGIQSLMLEGRDTPLTGEALSQWLTENSENVSVKQAQINMQPISIPMYGSTGELLETSSSNIEPRNSSLAKTYVEYNTSVGRTEENYIIRYQVKSGNNIYVINRDVKLTYKVGDFDLDMLTTSNDLILINSAISGTRMFKPAEDATEAEKAALTKLSNRVGDFDLDEIITSNDRILIRSVIAGAASPSARW